MTYKYIEGKNGVGAIRAKSGTIIMPIWNSMGEQIQDNELIKRIVLLLNFSEESTNAQIAEWDINHA